MGSGPAVSHGDVGRYIPCSSALPGKGATTQPAEWLGRCVCVRVREVKETFVPDTEQVPSQCSFLSFS